MRIHRFRLPNWFIAPGLLFASLAPAAGATDSGDVHLVSHITADGKVSQRTVPPGAIWIQSVSREGLGEARILVPGAPLDLIVQFDAPPIARARRQGIPLAACRAPMESFLRELPAIEARLAASRRSPLPGVRIKQRLETSFNGVVVSGPAELAEQLRQLSFVSGVFLDDTVRATLEQSVPLIGADQVRTRYGAQGEGVVVAILDTGIDYTHGALGGCFGPGCRVVTGIDLVNGDRDPLDDNGHGTHVAGIVGANAGVVGVAPAVRFHAYKVLDRFGSGNESTVIIAIDLALDPDRDPATDDAVDVINLSLGGGGGADSPLSQAVDEAVAAGVVVVAAAGNAGRFFTVGSPGAARGAITVGACTKTKGMSGFSSRGPASPLWDIKPDVIAPGQDILSTWPDNQYGTLSGTSMATPHVAGTAALLRQIHPTWSPARVKSALMNTAERITPDILGQGAGLIDAPAAAAAEVVIAPGSVSFGRVPVGLPSWKRQETLRLFNLSQITRTIQLAMEGTIPQGARVLVEPAIVTLAAGDSAEALVTLTVEAGVPYPLEEPFAYLGEIVARDGSWEARVPFAFYKAATLAVECDRPDVLMMIHDRAGHWTLHGQSASRLVRPGAYDVLAWISDNIRVVREGIAVEDSAQVKISPDEAIHVMRQVPVSETGQVLQSTQALDFLYHRATGVGVIVVFLWRDTEQFSSMSDAYSWEWTRYSLSPHRAYAFHAFRRGIDASATFQNAPGDLRLVKTQFRLPPGVEAIRPLHYVCNGPRGFPGNGGILGVSYFSALDPPVWEGTLLQSYVMEAPDQQFQFGSWYKSLHTSGEPLGPPVVATPYMRIDPGQPPRGYVMNEAEIPVQTLHDGQQRLGFGPPTWFGRFQNSSRSLRLHASLGRPSWIFPLQGGAWSDHQALPYALLRGSTPVSTGFLDGLGGFWGDQDRHWPLVGGPHTLEVTDDRYFVDGRAGVARATASFESGAADPDPPYLTSLSVLADGSISDAVGAETINEVRFLMHDDVGLTSVACFQRLAESDPWVAMQVVQDGTDYRARLPDSTGFLSLRLEGTDAAGNRLAYTVEPAVHILSAVAIGQTQGRAVVEGTTIELSWKVPSVLYDSVVIYRTEDGETWAELGTPRFAFDTVLFEDHDVLAEHRYGYRLGLVRGGLERLTPITWVDTPANVLAFTGALRNPSVGVPIVRFTLPDARPATIEVIDVTGRLMLTTPVGHLGVGPHRVSLDAGAPWRAGVYFLRLRHAEGILSRKVCVVR